LLGIGLGINHKIRTELAEVCIIPKKVKQSSDKDDAEEKTTEN
jgi:hypothetical protein